MSDVRDRRVVEEDARLAVRAALVAERVLHGGDVARRGAGEVVRAHRHGRLTVERNIVVGEHNLLPALSAVDREARILALELVHLHHFGADEVRHGHFAGGAERVLCRLGRLEEDIMVAVAVELAGSLSSGCHVVALLEVH